MPKTSQEIEDELRERAVAEGGENTAYPGEPTLTGLLRVLLTETVSLRIALEEQEEAQQE